MSLLGRIQLFQYTKFQINQFANASSDRFKDKTPIPQNPLKEVYGCNEQTNGEIYDKKPFKLELEAGKKYSWCLCGKSRTQPLCDGTHKDIFLKIKHRPIRFVVPETKQYWLCNCKQTSNRPFCDGTHKREDIQETHVRV